MPPGAPRVTVVVPCFQDGATVGEAVASARAQAPAPDVVVVDDGSADAATRDTLVELERSDARVIRQPNRGVSAARNAGLAAAATELVMPLDADDRLRPGAVARLTAALDAVPGAAAAWGSYQNFGAATHLQRTAPRLDPWQITFQNDLPSCALFRREALRAVGGWQLANGYEDWDLWMALAEAGCTGVGIPEVIYEYRRHDRPRVNSEAATRHAAIVGALRARHPALYAARAANRRASDAPLAVKLAFPVLERAPLPPAPRRVALGIVNHLARGRGVRTLLQRRSVG